jgi:hypothetical protein
LAGLQNNREVFFIAGSFGGPPGSAPVVRNFDVPHGKPIFFPMVTWVDVEGHNLPPCYDDPSFACTFAAVSGVTATPTTLHASLDGVNLLNFPSFFQASDALFNVDVPEDGLFGIPPNTAYVGAATGHWLAYEGLTKGLHALTFGASFPDWELNVIANLNVVPEPGTLWMLLPALAGLMRPRRRA